jgi:hypothetical protein
MKKVPVMIAERTLRLPHVRRHLAHEREFGGGDQRMRPLPAYLWQPFSGDERCEQQLRDVLRQRCDRGEHQRRRAPEKHGHRQTLAPGLRECVMVAAAFADLPVHPRGARAVHLHPVHPEVMAAAIGMGRVNEGQGDERAAVFRPAGQRRQPIQVHGGGRTLDDRTFGDPPGADL